MIGLEEVKSGVAMRGNTPEGLAKVVGVNWYGDQAIEVLHENRDRVVHGRVGLPSNLESLESLTSGDFWSLDGAAAGEYLRLVTEAIKIRPTYPYSAVYASHNKVLKHQIAAVYDETLESRLLRPLFIDDLATLVLALRRSRS